MMSQGVEMQGLTLHSSEDSPEEHDAHDDNAMIDSQASTGPEWEGKDGIRQCRMILKQRPSLNPKLYRGWMVYVVQIHHLCARFPQRICR